MSSIRKKRNFKGLQLADSPSSSSLSTNANASSSNSTSASNSSSTIGGSNGGAGGSRLLSSSSSPSGSSVSLAATSTTDRTLGRTPASASSSLSAVDPSSGANYHNTLTEQLKNLELGVEYKLDLKNEDLKVLSELGSGNGGTVTRVEHEKTGLVMARKTVFIDAKPAVRKQILRELQILHECNSPYIVSFYGAYLSEPHICMCMEFMDKSSLDTIWKKWGPIPPAVCGQVAVTVVQGLTYLYDAHRIIHRDVKPSNILVNSRGQIKICDFGVSGELINSIADTFVGTSTYMSPERIQGDQYSVKSDVWSLGITIIELALGRFPFADDDDEDDDEDDDDDDDDDDLRGTLSPTRLNGGGSGTARTGPPRRKDGVSLGGGGQGSTQMSMLELLQRIVNEPPPRLTPEPASGAAAAAAANPQSAGPPVFPQAMVDFVDLCVTKDPNARPTPKELTRNEYILAQMDGGSDSGVDLKKWVDGLV